MTKQLAEGDRLVQGDQGEVMGPTQAGENKLSIKFSYNKRNVALPLDVLSRTKPQILWEGDKDEFDRLASGNPSSSSRVDELKARRDGKKKMTSPQKPEQAAPTAEQEAAAKAAEAALLAELDAEEEKKGGASSSSSKSKKKKNKKKAPAAAIDPVESNEPPDEQVDDVSEPTLAFGGVSITEDCQDCEVDEAPAKAEAKADIDEDKLCVVCWKLEKTHALVPCGHYCLCEICADAVMEVDRKCPICREQSLMKMKVYG